MQLNEKKQFVIEFAKEIKNSKSLIVVDYQGLSVNSITELRRKLKRSNCTLKVIKNRLARRAIEDFNKESYMEILEFFNGPTAILIGDEDPLQAIKIFKEYAFENQLMKFKVGIISDDFFDKNQLDRLATLPSREVLIAMTVNIINAPINGLYNSLVGIIKKIFYCLNDLKTKIESKSPRIEKEVAELEAEEKTESKDTEKGIKPEIREDSLKSVRSDIKEKEELKKTEETTKPENEDKEEIKDGKEEDKPEVAEKTENDIEELQKNVGEEIKEENSKEVKKDLPSNETGNSEKAKKEEDENKEDILEEDKNTRKEKSKSESSQERDKIEKE